MCMSSPRLEISNHDDKWTIRTITMIRMAEVTFTLGEEYEEYMPTGVILKVLLISNYFIELFYRKKI